MKAIEIAEESRRRDQGGAGWADRKLPKVAFIEEDRHQGEENGMREPDGEECCMSCTGTSVDHVPAPAEVLRSEGESIIGALLNRW